MSSPCLTHLGTSSPPHYFALLTIPTPYSFIANFRTHQLRPNNVTQTWEQLRSTKSVKNKSCQSFAVLENCCRIHAGGKMFKGKNVLRGIFPSGNLFGEKQPPCAPPYPHIWAFLPGNMARLRAQGCGSHNRQGFVTTLFKELSENMLLFCSIANNVYFAALRDRSTKE